MDKRASRRALFARIRALAPEDRKARSMAMCDLLVEDDTFRQAGSVCSFLALPGEPDLSPLVAAFPEKRWAFSRVTPDDRLSFHAMAQASEAIPGSHGILEPDPLRHPEVSPLDADLFLIPGVGFDPSTGTRLGRGKGHYDRYLSAVRMRNVPAHLIGVAFSVQLLTLTAESHDVPMDRILTDQGWH